MTEISSTGDRMLSALETVAACGPVSAAELARRNGINRTVAHRLLSTLQQRSYLRRVAEGYVVGPAVLRLARTVEPLLIAAAMPHMVTLADETGETVVAHVVDGGDAVVVAQALGTRHLVRVQHEEGSRHRLTVGASGRALLAFRSEEAIEAILETVGEPQLLRRQLDAVRALGYAESHDELQAGAHGIAAPVRDRHGVPHASVALVVPTGRAPSVNEHIERLLNTGRQIEQRLFGAVGGAAPDRDLQAQTAP